MAGSHEPAPPWISLPGAPDVSQLQMRAHSCICSRGREITPSFFGGESDTSPLLGFVFSFPSFLSPLPTTYCRDESRAERKVSRETKERPASVEQPSHLESTPLHWFGSGISRRSPLFSLGCLHRSHGFLQLLGRRWFVRELGSGAWYFCKGRRAPNFPSPPPLYFFSLRPFHFPSALLISGDSRSRMEGREGGQEERVGAG